MAAGAIDSHEASGVFVNVMKSAVMNTDVTPSMPNSAAAVGSSTSPDAENVFGPPTSTPTVNFSAFGLGVLLIWTGTATPSSAPKGSDVAGHRGVS